MLYKKSLVDKIIKYGKLCGVKNYTPGTSGNISARYKDGLLITASGSSNGYLKSGNIVYTDFSGNSLEKGKKPSSEKFLHIEIYKKRADINFIIHVHAPYLSSFASAGKDLMAPIMAENVFYFGGIPLAEYALPSTMELVDNTVKFFDNYDAVLMANHGFIVGAKTIEEAYNKLELAESYARVVLNTVILGGAKYLSEDETQKILDLRNSI
ncbi:MAG: class II aldolase/adducin family protein [Cyanobacteria bacterium SIG28]|nr:class II aldolase/adducin family protein [Cyanobacteria bacterium SIG28]